MSFDSTSLMTLQAAQSSAQAKVQSGVISTLANTNGATQPTGKNAKLGLDFETMCLSNLLSPMFEGLSTDGPFGGGEGEAAVHSFYVDAIAKQMAKHGGVGISTMMQKQLLKIQEQQAQAASQASPAAQTSPSVAKTFYGTT